MLQLDGRLRTDDRIFSLYYLLTGASMGSRFLAGLGASLCFLFCLACNNQQAANLAKPVVPIAPKVKFDLSATAKRLDSNFVLIELQDGSQQGTRVLKVESPIVDELKDTEGQPIRGELRDFQLLKPEANESTVADQSFTLKLALRGSFPDEIGLIRGNFAVVLGDPEEVVFETDREGEISSNELKQLGVTVEVEHFTEVSIDLKGENVAQGYLVVADGEDQNTSGSFSSTGRNSARRGWRLKEPPTEAQEIRYWSSESLAQGKPQWTINSLAPGTVVSSELGIAGQISHKTQCSVIARGPKNVLLNARLLDRSGQTADVRPWARTDGVDNRWAFNAESTDYRLEIRVAHNSERAIDLFEFKNLKVEAAD